MVGTKSAGITILAMFLFSCTDEPVRTLHDDGGLIIEVVPSDASIDDIWLEGCVQVYFASGLNHATIQLVVGDWYRADHTKFPWDPSYSGWARWDDNHIWLHIPTIEGWTQDSSVSLEDAVWKATAHEFGHLICECPDHGESFQNAVSSINEALLP